MSGGGCSCDYCGAVFVGHEWEDGCCQECAAQVDTHAQRRDVKQARPDRVGSAVPKGCAQNKSA
jgi:hypothetical protein